MSVGTSVDPSLGMLGSIAESALDPDYATRADAVSSHATTAIPRSVRGRIASTLVIALTMAVLVGGIASLKGANTGVDAQRQELRQRITAGVGAGDAKASQVQSLRNQITQLAPPAVQEQADRTGVSALAAASQAQGPGATVILTDAATAGTQNKGDPSLGRVLDSDIQSAVNGLWAAGASAVAINGQRISSLSAIRSAGEAILVNYRPLSSPYVVAGIGENLASDFGQTANARSLQSAARDYGLGVQIEKSSSLTLPPALLTLRYAKVVQAKEARQ